MGHCNMFGMDGQGWATRSGLCHLNYIVQTPHRMKGRWLCHINMLKAYCSTSETSANNVLKNL